MSEIFIIISIISAVLALFIEIRCTEQSARVLWLGGLCVFYLVNLISYMFIIKNADSMPLAKQILIFILVAALSAIIAMTVASVFIALTGNKDKPAEENPPAEESDEQPEEPQAPTFM